MAKLLAWIVVFLIEMGVLVAITQVYGMHVDGLHLLIFLTMALGGLMALGFFLAMARGILSGSQWYPRR